MIMERFQNQLGQHLETNKILFYWKGRVALYALLKALGVGPGDEVILPAYTCVVVPSAIIYLGAKPVYVDICESTFNMDVSRLESALSNRTRVVICQNTYGLSSNLDEINALAHDNGIFTIEDCTHGFGGTYGGKPNGAICDASFFSSQWNKPFSSGIGGFATTKCQDVFDNLVSLENEKARPTELDKLNLKLLYLVRRYLINDWTYWPAVKSYRFLAKHHLVLGSSSGRELSAPDIPSGYLKDFSRTQAKEGMRNLSRLNDALQVRKQNARIYTKLLKKLGKRHVPDSVFDDHAFLKYPILVRDRDQFMRGAESRHIEVGDWFLSPLHPIDGDLSAWGLNRNAFPVATSVSRHVVNLPTNPTSMERVLDFVESNRACML